MNLLLTKTKYKKMCDRIKYCRVESNCFDNYNYLDQYRPDHS
jgi:hypothetical protein